MSASPLSMTANLSCLRMPRCRHVVRHLTSLMLLAPLLALQACGAITSQSVYEGVRSNEKARAVVTDKSRQELPPYDDYERQRSGAAR